MIRSYQALINRILIMLDAATVALAFFAAWYLKFNTQWFESIDSIGIKGYTLIGACSVLGLLFTNGLFGLYSSQRTKRLRWEIRQILKSLVISVLLVMSILFFTKEIHVSRVMLSFFLLFGAVLLTAQRVALRYTIRRFRAMGYNKKYMLIVGAGSLGRKVLHLMRDNRDFGFEVIGFLDDRLYPTTSQVDNVKLLGTIDELGAILERQMIDQVVLALPMDAHARLGHIIALCEKVGVQTLIIPDYFSFLPARPRFEEVGGLPMIDVRHVPLDNVMNAGLKRTFDIVLSLMALILLLPMLLLIALAVKVSSPGPVFFAQERVGKNRRSFKMYKFRSMKFSNDGVSDTKWTTQNDSRKTRVGAFLRKTSLDELPQFYNVLKGDMSIIGPRPERPHFVDMFKDDIPKYMIKHRVRPGITGWAQINGWRGDTSIEERIKCDIEYIENWTFGMDLKIVLKTVINGFLNKNAY